MIIAHNIYLQKMVNFMNGAYLYHLSARKFHMTVSIEVGSILRQTQLNLHLYPNCTVWIVTSIAQLKEGASDTEQTLCNRI
jgi:hypothetical protein